MSYLRCENAQQVVVRSHRRGVVEPQVVTELGTADIDARLEELLIDGILYAFQEQVSDDANVMLNGFGTVVNALKVNAAGVHWPVHLPLPYIMPHAVLADCECHGTVMKLLSKLLRPSQGRAKPYLPQICGTIKWRLNNKSAKIRQQAADLIARIALVMKVRCGKYPRPAYFALSINVSAECRPG